MDFSGMNPLAILLAMVASMIIGAIWYSVLAKPWIKAVGFSEEEFQAVEKGGSPIIYLFAALSHLVMATILAGLIGHLGTIGLRGGMIVGLFMWAGFVATTMVVNHRFQMKPWSLTLIDSSHYLFILLAQGAILGWFGVSG